MLGVSIASGLHCMDGVQATLFFAMIEVLRSESEVCLHVKTGWESSSTAHCGRNLPTIGGLPPVQ